MAKWIQKAIKNPKSLRRWLKRGGARKVAAATKKPVWTRTGEINVDTLKAFRKTKAYEKLDARTKRRINLAITLKKLAGRRSG